MNTTALAILSICAYLASTLLIIRHIGHNRMRRATLYPAWLAVCAHLLYTALVFNQNQGFNFGFLAPARWSP